MSIHFDPLKSAWLWSLVGVGLTGLPFLDAQNVSVALVLAFFTVCVGHSVAVHRGLIHQTYRTSAFAQGLGAWLMVLTGLGGPVSWIRLHRVRDHWQNRHDGPAFHRYDHGVLQDFWWNLHCRSDLGEDGVADPWLRFLERTWPLHVLGLALLLLPWLGPGGVAVAVCARSAVTILGHWAIGYLAHTHGETRFHLEGADVSGTNLPLLGVLSFGEGFHNNHHAWPGSARMGIRPRELDVGWWVIRGLERVGVVWAVQSWDRDPALLRPNAVDGEAGSTGAPAAATDPERVALSA
jgi:sn-1 stearoyl-lipid 9-desaturase